MYIFYLCLFIYSFIFECLLQIVKKKKTMATWTSIKWASSRFIYILFKFWLRASNQILQFNQMYPVSGTQYCSNLYAVTYLISKQLFLIV